ncbi:MAG: hypothetical protein JXR61_10095 [Prolixibacteraceae bacterium]|nr:hypothetical protein [Prolixibacteraceae bacterium]
MVEAKKFFALIPSLNDLTEPLDWENTFGAKENNKNAKHKAFMTLNLI